MSALVIKHSFDNVRQHAEVGHASSDRAPYVVDAPAPYGVSKFLVEIGLGVPMREPVRRAGTEQVIATEAVRRALNDAHAISGTTCSLPFLVRSAGIVQVLCLISVHRMPPTSARRAPVRINNLITRP
jgi:hypothetical protein